MLRRLTQQWVSQTPLVTGSPSVAHAVELLRVPGAWALALRDVSGLGSQPSCSLCERTSCRHASQGARWAHVAPGGSRFPSLSDGCAGPLGVATVGPLPPAPAASGRAGRAAAVFRPSPDVAEAVWELRSESAVWVSVDTCNCN